MQRHIHKAWTLSTIRFTADTPIMGPILVQGQMFRVPRHTVMALHPPRKRFDSGEGEKQYVIVH